MLLEDIIGREGEKRSREENTVQELRRRARRMKKGGWNADEAKK